MTRVNVIAVVFLISLAGSVSGFNITAILEPFEQYNVFSQWLTLTGLVDEINAQASITALVTDNTTFTNYLTSVNGALNIETVRDTLRYQILLTYFATLQLEKIPVNNYTTAATLLQRTGRIQESEGFVSIYNLGPNFTDPFLVGHYPPDTYGNQTIIANVTNSPLVAISYSVLELSYVLVPIPPALPSPTPAPTPGGPSPIVTPSLPTSPPAPAGPDTAPVKDKNHGESALISIRTNPLVLFAILLASAFGITLL